MATERSAPPERAQCGEDIPRGARACPGCGADERTGWREVDPVDGLDLPGDEEPRREDPRKVNGLAWYWWAVGVALLLLLGLGMLGRR